MNKESIKNEIDYLFNDLMDEILQSNFVPLATDSPYGNTEVICSKEYSEDDISKASQEAKEILQEIVGGLDA